MDAGRGAVSRSVSGAHALAAVAVFVMLACGPSPHRIAAEDTVRTASAAIAEARSSGGETPELEASLSDAEQWLAHAEEAVDLWNTGAPRSLAYETVAPCLARALGEVRESLGAAGREVPETLETAEAAAAAVSDEECPGR